MNEAGKSKMAIWVSGGLATLLVATTLFGYARAGGSNAMLAFALLGSTATAAFVYGLQRRRLVAWLASVSGGSFAGWLASAELLWNEPFEQQFFVAVATFAFFIILGICFGALAEFIRLMHFLLHGGRIWEYPQRSPVASDVDKKPETP